MTLTKSLQLYLSITLLCMLSGISSAASSSIAKSSSSSVTLTKSQKLYQQAVEAFKSNRSAEADKLTLKLKDYPLYPYLQLRQLKRDIATANDQDLVKFIQKYNSAPFADDLQAARLDNLFKAAKWQKYLQAETDFKLTSAKYQCQRAIAQLKSGKSQDAMQAAAKLWQVGRSQHSACDPLFSVWMKTGYPNEEQAVARFWAAAKARSWSTAKYAEKFIKKPNNLKDTKLLWAIRKAPEKTQNNSQLNPKNQHHGDVFAYGVRQLARKKLDTAFTLWIKYREDYKLTNEVSEKLNHYFAMRYAKNYYPNATKTLDKIDPKFQQGKITEWRIRVALKNQQWDQVINLIKQLPHDLKINDRWVYWDETAKHKLDPSYQANYSAITKNRSYYGYLAAALNNQVFSLDREYAGISQVEKDRIKALPAMQRIKELLAFDYQYAARSEWNSMVKNLEKRDRHIAAHIAYDWNWHDQAIRGAARLKAWNDTDIRFPSPHKQVFKEWASTRDIPETWAIAIARQESAFHQYAKSSVGARGLMQLMPRTAKTTAKKYQVAYKNTAELFNPKVNIALGTAYLAQMLEKFKNSKIFASAAYNAGPSRVQRWLKDRGHLPLDIWVETIPFDETRNYVQNVMAFNVIYSLLKKQKPIMFNVKEQQQLTPNIN